MGQQCSQCFESLTNQIPSWEFGTLVSSRQSRCTRVNPRPELELADWYFSASSTDLFFMRLPPSGTSTSSQYDPLGLLLPYTTRAKIIIRQLWNKQRGWDDQNLPPELLQSWRIWENFSTYRASPSQVLMSLLRWRRMVPHMTSTYCQMLQNRHMELWHIWGPLTREAKCTSRSC